MKAAILCPGPSLAGVTQADIGDCELVVAVNRAATYLHADYVTLLDPYTFGWCRDEGFKGKPGIVAARDIYEQMCAAFPEAEHHRFLQRKNDWLPVPGLQWFTKGLTTALVLAYVKGADQIRCYGVDWLGTEDFDGFTNGRQQREPKRWANEISLVRAVCHQLTDRGVRVTGLPGVTEERKVPCGAR